MSTTTHQVGPWAPVDLDARRRRCAAAIRAYAQAPVRHVPGHFLDQVPGLFLARPVDSAGRPAVAARPA